MLASRIIALCEQWRVEPRCAADDATFAKTGHDLDTITDEFRHGCVQSRCLR